MQEASINACMAILGCPSEQILKSIEVLSEASVDKYLSTALMDLGH